MLGATKQHRPSTTVRRSHSRHLDPVKRQITLTQDDATSRRDGLDVHDTERDQFGARYRLRGWFSVTHPIVKAAKESTSFCWNLFCVELQDTPACESAICTAQN